ncbi:hypothetical protein M426DRAFT_28650 [Hypoxylon sp. CI-4A]|nr:hypothetical protein M426DRAFT_28650 [Hypoxylon sp. CI-4A]
MSRSEGSRLQVAIIGGGITGLILALGLQKREVDFTLYERASAFTELGAGIGFSPNAERALKVIDPEVYRVYKQVVTATNAIEYFSWINGYTDEVSARLLIGVDAFQGGRRSDFLEAWSKLIASDKTKFGKELESTTEKENGRVSMQFKDGSVEEADIGNTTPENFNELKKVIGCDGIHSRVRQLILGETNSASYPGYTSKYCYRALIPMEKARSVLHEDRIWREGQPLNRFMGIGHNAHYIIYPVSKGHFMNVLFVVSDPNPWHTEDDKHTAPGNKADLLRAFADWHPNIVALINLLPESLQKWAIFDMFENPAPHYHSGSVAVAGDAAHAAGPHLGSGAGFGIEDGLVLATLLEAVNGKLQNETREDKAELCRAALKAYNSMRYDRTQWLVGATREACTLFHWQDKAVGSDFDKFLPEISKRFHTIWDNDIDEMVNECLSELERTLAG